MNDIQNEYLGADYEYSGYEDCIKTVNQNIDNWRENNGQI